MELPVLTWGGDFPWFWGCDGDGTDEERTNFDGGASFDGNRWNDIHYANEIKVAARRRSDKEASR